MGLLKLLNDCKKSVKRASNTNLLEDWLSARQALVRCNDFIRDKHIITTSQGMEIFENNLNLIKEIDNAIREQIIFNG